MKKRKKAAHFLSLPELACSPQNEALISAYLDLGCEVDLFTPGGSCDVRAYGDRVACRPVEYGLRWLLRHAILPFWRRYTLFSGTSEDPLAVVGSCLPFIDGLPLRWWMRLSPEATGGMHENPGNNYADLGCVEQN